MGTHRTKNNGWVKTGSHNGEFELEERYGMQNYDDRTRTNIGVGGSRSGSEDMIIQGKEEDGKGIMKTTVITVS
jgi:hypothetical protein